MEARQNTSDISVEQDSFRKFIQCISYVTQFPVTFNILKDRIDVVAVSNDNASVFFHGTVRCRSAYEGTIHLKDISKLNKLFEFNKDKEFFNFSIIDNYFVYKKEHVCEAKFVLNSLPYNNMILSQKSNLFSQDGKILQANVHSNNIRDVLQSVHLASDSKKVYVYDDNGELIAELNDKQTDNIDSIKLNITNSVQGHVDFPVIVDINSFKSLPINITDNFNFCIIPKTAGSKSYNVLLVSSRIKNVDLNYIFNPIVR